MTPEQRIEHLERLVFALIRKDGYTFEKGIRVADGVTISVGGTQGLRIGSSGSEKIGFFGTTPAAQHTDNGASTALTRGTGGSLAEDATWAPTGAARAYHIGDAIAALVEVGLLE